MVSSKEKSNAVLSNIIANDFDCFDRSGHSLQYVLYPGKRLSVFSKASWRLINVGFIASWSSWKLATGKSATSGEKRSKTALFLRKTNPQAKKKSGERLKAIDFC